MEAAIFCLAQALYFEARSEPIAEQLMVANVIINRVESDKYPNSICDVINQNKQFSYLSDGKPETISNRKAWNQSIYLANLYMNHKYDYHEGCHYHADYSYPYWRNGYKLIYKGKTHLFYEGGC